MKKRILITGATDGIGLKTAELLASRGHHLLLHGRSAEKLEKAKQLVGSAAEVETFKADLSRFDEVEQLARDISEGHEEIDVIINNAGVFMVPEPKTPDGLDLRFVVNTIAPYLLTKRLLPLLGSKGRVVNLSSAAQSSVDLEALKGERALGDGEAYAQSKLALTMWSRHLALAQEGGPAVIAVNPGSFLGSKMVSEAYGMAGKDLSIGAKILARAALDEEFASASGKYFDNDAGQFAEPHADVSDARKREELMAALEDVLKRILGGC